MTAVSATRRSLALLLALLVVGLCASAAAQADLPNLVQIAPYKLAVQSTGMDQKLGFGSAVHNAGPGSLYLQGFRPNTTTPNMTVSQTEFNSSGQQVASYPNVAQFQFSPSAEHFHWHLLSFDTFSLHAVKNFKFVAPGEKTGFCLGGFDPNFFCGKGHPELTSIVEGMPVGNTDDYDPFLEGQSIDVTNLPAGNYCLEFVVNQGRLMKETDYSDNAASTELALGPSLSGQRSLKSGDEWPKSGKCGMLTSKQAKSLVRKAAGAIAKHVPSGFHTSCKQTGFGDYSCKSRWSASGRAFAGTLKISDRPAGNGADWFYNAKLSQGTKHSAKGRGGKVTLTG